MATLIPHSEQVEVDFSTNLGKASSVSGDGSALLESLLRTTGTEGVTAIHGELSGFSVRSSGLGSQPLIVGAAGKEIVIAYGPRAAAQALRAKAKFDSARPDLDKISYVAVGSEAQGDQTAAKMIIGVSK